MRIDINNTIEIDNEAMSDAFARGDAAEQAEFLDVIAHKCQCYNWCMQASMVVRELEDLNGVESFLEILLAHIKETKNDKR